MGDTGESKEGEKRRGREEIPALDEQFNYWCCPARLHR